MTPNVPDLHDTGETRRSRVQPVSRRASRRRRRSVKIVLGAGVALSPGANRFPSLHDDELEADARGADEAPPLRPRMT